MNIVLIRKRLKRYSKKESGSSDVLMHLWRFLLFLDMHSNTGSFIALQRKVSYPNVQSCHSIKALLWYSKGSLLQLTNICLYHFKSNDQSLDKISFDFFNLFRVIKT